MVRARRISWWRSAAILIATKWWRNWKSFFPGQSTRGDRIRRRFPPTQFSRAQGAYLVNKPDVNQGRVEMMLPGITRDNPDYFSIIVMNDILGGGGFTSRIMNRVRTEEGLAYDAHTSFPGGVYYPLTFSVGYQSKSRTVAYAASLAMEEIKKMQSRAADGFGTDHVQERVHRSVSAVVRDEGAGGGRFCAGRIHRALCQGPEFLQEIS